RRVPDATFSVYGFNPTDEARRLTAHPGITLHPDLPDLRSEVVRHQVVVLPFVSGGGIKNKLLEAASMGRPIVCTPRACQGLRQETALPLVQARQPAEWVEAVVALWQDGGQRRQLGSAAREWVLRHHTWESSARAAVASLEQSLVERRR